MNIDLSLIKPSPTPIRTTWDEDKLDELAQSIKYMGLIAPIKVRPADEDAEVGYDEDVMYEIVYGHRRVAALRIAGFTETDAIVEGMGDTDALIQSLIENVQREDMEPIDEANAYRVILDATSWSIRELSRRIGRPHQVINNFLLLLDETSEVKELITKKDGGRGVNEPGTGITESHVRVTRHSIKDNPKEREHVLKKANQEGLSTDQTRKVAESVAATKDPKKREYLLDTEFSSFIHDPEIVKFEESIPKEKSKPDLGSAFDPTPEVGWILEYLSAWTKKVDKFIEATEAGKFSPEAQAFTARRTQIFVNKLSDWIEILEGEDV